MDLFDFLQQKKRKPECERWNYETHDYEPYELPEGAMLLSDDMDAECVCAQCGHKMKYGDGFTSIEILSRMGFGYCVCRECYDAEWQRRREAESCI